MIELPHLQSLSGDGLRALLWMCAEPTTALSSAAVGGGTSQPNWVLNIQVPLTYGRVDLQAHLAEVANELGVRNQGVGLFTATDIQHWKRGERDGVIVDVTSGVTKPTYAASVDGGWNDWLAVYDDHAKPSADSTPGQAASLAEPTKAETSAGTTMGSPESDWSPGTINIVAHFPVALTPSAAVNAVITATEAKSQALQDLDIPGTGTASDAITVLWPTAPTNGDAAIEFTGPRSPWGSALALATHQAVLDSARASIDGLER